MNNKFYFVAAEKTVENKISNIGFQREVINYLTAHHPLVGFKEEASEGDKIINKRILFFTEIEEELYQNVKALFPEGD